MTLPSFVIHDAPEKMQIAEYIPAESEKHILGEFSKVLHEVNVVYERALNSGDMRMKKVYSYMQREQSVGKLTEEQMSSMDSLPKIFRRVEEVGDRYTADEVLAQNLAALQLATHALESAAIPINSKIEIATFALMLTSSSITTNEFDIDALKTNRSDGYKPGAATASISGLLSYMLTSRNSENTAINKVAESVEKGMTTTIVFLEKQHRPEAVEAVYRIACGVRGEMVASETLDELCEKINFALESINGDLSEDAYKVISKASKAKPEIKNSYSAAELTYYEQLANISFLDLYDTRGWVVITEKIKQLRTKYNPYFELAKRLSETRHVQKISIKRLSSIEDYLSFGDFEIVGYRQGQQEGSSQESFKLPIDVKTVDSIKFNPRPKKGQDKIEKAIYSDLVHSELYVPTGDLEEDTKALNALERPPSPAAIKHISETKQPLLMMRIPPAALSKTTLTVKIHAEDPSGKEIFTRSQQVVNLKEIPRVSKEDLDALAYSVALSPELHG